MNVDQVIQLYPHFEELIGGDSVFALGGYSALVKQGILKEDRDTKDIDLCIFCGEKSYLMPEDIWNNMWQSLKSWNKFNDGRIDILKDILFRCDYKQKSASMQMEEIDIDEQRKRLKSLLGVNKIGCITLSRQKESKVKSAKADTKEKVSDGYDSSRLANTDNQFDDLGRIIRRTINGITTYIWYDQEGLSADLRTVSENHSVSNTLILSGLSTARANTFVLNQSIANGIQIRNEIERNSLRGLRDRATLDLLSSISGTSISGAAAQQPATLRESFAGDHTIPLDGAIAGNTISYGLGLDPAMQASPYNSYSWSSVPPVIANNWIVTSGNIENAGQWTSMDIDPVSDNVDKGYSFDDAKKYIESKKKVDYTEVFNSLKAKYQPEALLAFNNLFETNKSDSLEFDLFFMSFDKLNRSTVVIDGIRYVHYYTILKAKYEYCLNKMTNKEGFDKHIKDLEESFKVKHIYGVNSPKDIEYLINKRNEAK